MSEYIVNVPDEEAELFIARFGINGTTMFGYQLVEEIVRCRDCEFLDTDGYCTLLEFWHGDISDKFCAWGERRQP